MNKWIRWCEIYTWILCSHGRKGNPDIYLDGPWGHCTMWDKSNKDRQILYDISYMWN